MKINSFYGRLVNLLLCVLLSSAIVSCGSSSSSSDDSSSSGSTATNNTNVKTGVFVDDVVSGIHYKSGTLEGTTNAAGEFKYEEGKEVVLSLGDVELGRSIPREGESGETLITPLDLIPDASADKEVRINNMVRLLLTLDSDPSTPGITIKNEVAEGFKGEIIDFGQNATVFTNSVQPKVRRIRKDNALVLKTKDEAKKHFNKSLENRGIVPTPKLSVTKIRHEADFNLTISLPVDDASIDIYYTLDGQDPNVTDPRQKYLGAITIRGEGDHILKTVAFNAKNKVRSKIIKVEYLIEYPELVASPVFNLKEGTYKERKQLEASCSTRGAKIYYTTNGKNPVPGENGTKEFPSGSLSIDRTTLMKVIAVKDGESSKLVTKNYILKQPDLTFNLDQDIYQARQTLEILSSSDSLSKGTIHYTLDGTKPTADSSSDYTWRGIEINKTTTVKAISIKENWENSDVASVTITIDPHAKPRLARPDLPNDSTRRGSFDVTVAKPSRESAGAEIYYTLDGADPVVGNSNTKKCVFASRYPWSCNINITKSSVLRAIAVKNGFRTSFVAVKTYKVQLNNPEISPSSRFGTKNIKLSEKISLAKNKYDLINGIKIYYSLISKADLAIDEAHLYKNSFSLTDKDTTVYFKAVKDGYEPSDIGTQIYQLVLSKPGISLEKGNYTTDQTIELSIPKNEEKYGAEIRYTMDGTDPTSDSTLYDAPIQLTKTGDYTLKAISVKGELKSSITLARKYKLDKRPPAFEFIDANGIRKGNAKLSEKANPKLAEKGGELYSAWIEAEKLHVARYNKVDSTWDFITEDNGVNRDSSKAAITPSIAVFKNQIYLSWIEDNKVRVSKYTGSTWEAVEGRAGHLNRDGNYKASSPQLYVFKGGLFLTWWENKGRGDLKSKIFVSRYNGTGWVNADTDPAVGLSGVSDTTVKHPQMTEFNNELYVLWTQAPITKECPPWGRECWNPTEVAGTYNLYLQKYVEPGKWKNAKNLDMIKNNQEYSKIAGTDKASQPTFIKLDNSKLYLSWQEFSGRILVSEFDGASIKRVDADRGIQENASGSTTILPKMMAYKGKIYVVWQEKTPAEIMIKKYDGSRWDTLDAVQRLGRTPDLVTANGNLYMIWNDGKIRVAKLKK